MLDAAAFCRGLVEDGTIYAFLADHRDELFKEEDFADLFPSGRGRPSIPAVLVCSVMVLQALEGLSDRDAIRQLRTRIDWKVACGLALDDPGFDFTVLTYWRTRLRKSAAPAADLRRGARRRRGDRRARGQAPPSPRLDHPRRRRRHPGHRHPAHLGDEEGAPGCCPRRPLVPLSTATDEGGKPVIEWSDKVRQRRPRYRARA